MKRYTVAVDFDGVLHSYTTPWVNAHTIPDPPIPGALGWLHDILQDFEVAIYSTRCKTWRGRRAVRAWLKKHAPGLWYEQGIPSDRGLEDVVLSYKKPPALIYIDDRGWRFEGRFPTKAEIHRARPWKLGDDKIASAGPALAEAFIANVSDGVVVKRLADDPVCLRASIGGQRGEGYYLTYRGEPDKVQLMLETALEAFKATTALSPSGQPAQQAPSGR